MSRWVEIVAMVLVLGGCARFEPRPLLPAETARSLENRSLEDPGLRTFVETNLHRAFPAWAPRQWDFEMLTLAAMYFHPSLEVARAQWAVATAATVTASQRPNPTLMATPGYDTTTSVPSPWIPSVSLDVPIETAGKRRWRGEQAGHLAQAARLGIASAVWDVRSALRMSLLDWLAAERRQKLLKEQLSLQERILKLLEGQSQAGAITETEIAPNRIAYQRARLELAGAQQLAAEARARIAESLGVPLRALEGVEFAIPWLDESPGANVPPTLSTRDLAELRRAALQNRPDILQALAEYAAAESALRLEIARQYPDLRLGPGYQYDQGDNKWTLALSLELPILNQNQGQIAEAKARRKEAAVRFTALQAKVLGEVERATQGLASSEKSLAMLRSLAAEQARRRAAVQEQFQAGAVDQVELLNAQLESATAQLLQLEGRVRTQQAWGAVEDAVRRASPKSEEGNIEH